MRKRFRLYKRKNGGRYYIHDEVTGKQDSLHTSDRATAVRLFHSRQEAEQQPACDGLVLPLLVFRHLDAPTADPTAIGGLLGIAMDRNEPYNVDRRRAGRTEGLNDIGETSWSEFVIVQHLQIESQLEKATNVLENRF